MLRTYISTLKTVSWIVNSLNKYLSQREFILKKNIVKNVEIISGIIVILSLFNLNVYSKQSKNCIFNSSKYQISDIAPEYLSLPYLLGSIKYRTIHHDTFCREVNHKEIGNNALPSRSKILGYTTMSIGSISVGINKSRKSPQQLSSYFKNTKEIDFKDKLSQDDIRRYNHYVSNFTKSTIFGRAIKYIDTKRSSYHATLLRADDETSDSKLAFFITDINNFYFTRISNSKIEIGQYLNGKKSILFLRGNGGKEVETFINGQSAIIMVDGEIMDTITTTISPSQICGLLFDNSSVSNVDEFIVNYEDEYQDVGIDIAVENNNIHNGVFGHHCAFENRCVTSSTNVKSGEKSYKFTLIKPSQDEVVLNRNNALHSTVMLNGIISKGGNDYQCQPGGNKPLDSYVFTVDVFFPEKGDERWELDELYNELFIQEHHVGWPIPFSPSISININRGRLLINTIWQESIPNGTAVNENPTTTRRQYFGRINTDSEEQYLYSKGLQDLSYLPEFKKGQWHNFTLYVKLGYTFGQKPRTILYVDNKKMIDWHTPNAYNCQEYGEYLEFGIYKWDWESQEKRDKTPIQKRVIYFDNIHYYI